MRRPWPRTRFAAWPDGGNSLPSPFLGAGNTPPALAYYGQELAPLLTTCPMPRKGTSPHPSRSRPERPESYARPRKGGSPCTGKSPLRCDPLSAPIYPFRSQWGPLVGDGPPLFFITSERRGHRANPPGPGTTETPHLVPLFFFSRGRPICPPLAPPRTGPFVVCAPGPHGLRPVPGPGPPGGGIGLILYPGQPRGQPGGAPGSPRFCSVASPWSSKIGPA
jgi:hypothetical protein